ncbi:hypothetical protein [Lysinibacillus fusiformis]|uniref:hypothetical protein n=1 Tax=Lysinibacillus fusiformis TaxID=28031 RepID=UPI001EF6E183|nr:hypothetical protein [Lysinibacillus fusiformis]MCG7435671.1 hypothetical protein [Lysinibacillus fusiformis]
MPTLSRSDIRTIERYWIELEQNRKKLKYREWELLHPHNEGGEMVGGRSNAISDTTAKKAMLLANDDYYQNLKRIIKTVEDLYNELDEGYAYHCRFALLGYGWLLRVGRHSR